MPMDRRPEPDELLKLVREEASSAGKGRLKIFLGAAPGVGKTYAMLEAARARRAEGVEVVAGWVVTHGREETQALLDGLEELPPRILSYRGKELQEFDLEGALERKPALILVDELAHTNAPGSRHGKRWQDVRDLLDAGIDVYSTLNVQHIESLNDIVAQITGVTVRERIPDAVLAGADEVELVDLPPDDLLQRLGEGKVYIPEEAQRAKEHFFRPGNLIALREIALRQTAERVDAQMQRYRRDHSVRDVWPAGERILVCLGPSPYGQRLVRSAKLLSSRLRAEWIALYVETPAHARLAPADRDQLRRTLVLAEKLGAEVVTLTGQKTSEELLHYARSRNVTKIVLGKPPRQRWLAAPSLVDQVIRGSEGIDIHVVGGVAEERLARMRGTRRKPLSMRPYLYSLAVVCLCGLISSALNRFAEPANLVMIFLLGVVFASVRLGTGPAILASVLSVATFDFFFVPPHLTFAVADTQYLVTFVVMLAVALTVANLAARVRQQAEAARARERETAALYRLSQNMAREREPSGLADAAAAYISDHHGAPSAVFLPDEGGLLRRVAESGWEPGKGDSDPVARWVFDHGLPAGQGTDTLPGSEALYLPLEASSGTVGVLAVKTDETLASETGHTLALIAIQVATAVERSRLAESARKSQMEAESERMRSALLSSISHDFRTPLATVVGASSALLAGPMEETERRELAQSIYEESERLGRYINNLLDLTRLEAGTIALDRQWQPLEEVVGAALGRLKPRLEGRQIAVAIPEDLPMVAVDARLLEQLFMNLLENAAKYTPPGTPVDISAKAAAVGVEVRVEDRGPGFQPGSEGRIFEKFYRGSTRKEGAGLGLAICHAIIALHGGSIRAENREGGGALFIFTIPEGGSPPPMSVVGDPAKGERT